MYFEIHTQMYQLYPMFQIDFISKSLRILIQIFDLSGNELTKPIGPPVHKIYNIDWFMLVHF